MECCFWGKKTPQLFALFQTEENENVLRKDMIEILMEFCESLLNSQRFLHQTFFFSSSFI